MANCIRPIVAVLTVACFAAPAFADAMSDCFGTDNDRSIAGCSKLIARGHASGDALSRFYAKRGVAYSLKGRYATAIRDYDVAIRIKPNFSEALNNRAWAYFRLGKPKKALPDVERALEVMPRDPHALDTRGHILRSLGQLDAALRDYNEAMSTGGAVIIRIYQCGLAAAGLYKGETDGVLRPELQTALETCAHVRGCSPVPVSERCPS
jgi:tetratricopeptide (TPR) repeat protein